MFVLRKRQTPCPPTIHPPSATLMVRYSYGKNPDRNPPSSSMDEEYGHFRWSGFRPSALFSHARFARSGGIFYLLYGFRAHLHHQRYHRSQSRPAAPAKVPPPDCFWSPAAQIRCHISPCAVSTKLQRGILSLLEIRSHLRWLHITNACLFQVAQAHHDRRCYGHRDRLPAAGAGWHQRHLGDLFLSLAIHPDRSPGAFSWIWEAFC